MKLFGKNITLNEDEIVVDSTDAELLLWRKGNRETALSVEKDKAGKDKAIAEWKDKATLDERKTFLCEDFWEDFVLLSKVCLLRNPDADIYDVFETIRVKFLGGWGFTKEFTNKLDAEIETEYQKQCLMI